MTYARLFDSVFAELSAGRIDEGINLLVGMLDAIEARGGAIAAAGVQLRSHELGAMLQHDPLFSRLPDAGGDDGRIALIAGACPPGAIGSTGRRLFGVTSKLTLSRALRARRGAAGRAIERAWEQGQRICVIGGGALLAAEALAGRDLGNVVVIERDPSVSRLLDDRFGMALARIAASPAEYLTASASNRAFSFICAAELPDLCAGPVLTGYLRAMRARLAGNGTIALAALVPGHPGTGWRRAYLGWEPYCHDTEALGALGRAADLVGHTHLDETGCVVWSVLSTAGRSRATCAGARP